uniref:DUF4399 domain-containing protein n=1 Tax=Leptospirillum ferriphilum TaxID=178606 RepID=A0A7C3LTA0_9BACT
MRIRQVGVLMAGLSLAFMAVAGTGTAWSAEKTSVKIVSPKSGAVVHDPFMLKYIYHKGPRANHVHVYVDGTLYKPTHANPVRMDIPKGKHVITVKAATRHHHLLGPKSQVTVNVQ